MEEPEEGAPGREDRMQREDGWVSFWDNSGRLAARVPDNPDPRATVSYGTLPPRKPIIVPLDGAEADKPPDKNKLELIVFLYSPDIAGERMVYSYDAAGALSSVRKVDPGEPMPGLSQDAGLPREWNVLRQTLKSVDELHPGPIIVVETGTAGNARCRGPAGEVSSTFAWAMAAGRRGGRVYTVDPDPAVLEAVRRETVGFSCVERVEAEPVDFLRRWREEHPGETIHLLYLDSVETYGRDAIDRRHVEEALAAAPAMAERGLVLFREAAGGEGAGSEGQGGRAARFLSERGVRDPVGGGWVGASGRQEVESGDGGATMSTTLRRYYRGHSLVAMRDVPAGANRYYHFDHQGTTQCLTDQSGAVTDRFASDAWGVEVKRTGPSINRNWYIGGLGYHQQVDTPRLYVRARFLRVELGRWQSRDPLVPSYEDLAYSYVSNKSSLLTDPSGLQAPSPRPHLGVKIILPGRRVGCGGFESTVEWKQVPPVFGRPGQIIHGAVIQHIKVTAKVTDCDGNPNPDAEKIDGFEFWEAWPYQNHEVVIAGRVRNEQDFFTLPSFGNDTKGTTRIEGEVKYFHGYRVIHGSTGPWYYPPTIHPRHIRINIPMTTAKSPKPPVNMRGATKHYIKWVDWSCCCQKQDGEFDWQPKKDIT